MANILEYTLSLQDKLSAKLQKIGINNDMALEKFAELEKKSSEVSKGFKSLGTNVTTLTEKIQLLKNERDLLPIESLPTIRKYNSEIKKLEKDVTKLETLNGSKVKTWFKDALNGLPGIATNPLVLLGAGIGKSVKDGMEADMQKSNILTLLKGDADKAKKLYKDLSNYGIKSPYDKAGLIDAQQTMMSFGLTSEDSFKKLKQIGDIAMGDSQKMKSLSLAFAQSSSAGKLNGQDLNQMINAGFNPLLVISEKTGESMTSLKDRMSKGEIGIDEVSKAFEIATSKGGDFYKAAENASNTLGGKWSNMMESFSELSLAVYSAVEPIIAPIIEIITELMESIGGGLSWLIQKFQEGNPYVLAIAYSIGIFTTALILYNTYIAITEMLQNKLTLAVLKTNLAFLANPIVWIIAGVLALIAAIVWLVTSVTGWGEAWKHVVKGAKLIFLAYVEGVKLYFSTLVNGILIGIDKIKLGWYKFKNAMGIGDKSANNEAIAKINADTEARKKAIVDGAKKVKDLAVESGKEFKLAAGSLKLKKTTESSEKTTTEKGGIKTSEDLMEGITAPGAAVGNGSKGEKGGAKTNESIVTGGTKNTVINITMKNLVEMIQIMKGNGFKESAQDMEEEVTDALLRSIAMASSTAG